MEIRDLDHIRFVTQRFHDLQGLRHLVPLGLIALSGAGTAYSESWPLVLLSAVLFSGAFLLALGAGRYYRSTFGEVERPRVQPVAELSSLSIFSPAGPAPLLESPPPAIRGAQRCLLILGLAPAVYLLFQFLFWPPWIGLNQHVVVDPEWPLLPVDFSPARDVFLRIAYPLCGAFFLAVWWSRGRRLSQSHHLAIGILLSGLSVLDPRLVPAAAWLWVALLVCGSSMVLAGLLDHWQLVRVFGRPVASEEEE